MRSDIFNAFQACLAFLSRIAFAREDALPSDASSHDEERERALRADELYYWGSAPGLWY